jgi:hypothetical protein
MELERRNILKEAQSISITGFEAATGTDMSVSLSPVLDKRAGSCLVLYRNGHY